MNDDPIRRVLEPFLSDYVDIMRDDISDCIVTFRGDLEDDETYLQWRRIDAVIKNLGGSWVKATKYTRAHWRIQKSAQNELEKA